MQISYRTNRPQTFKKYSELLQKNLDSAVAEVTNGLRDTAKANAPVLTAALRESIHSVYWRRGANSLYSGYESAAMRSAKRAAFGGRYSHTIMPFVGPPERWEGTVAAIAAYAEIVEYTNKRKPYYMTKSVHEFERQATFIVHDWIRRTKV